MSALRLEHVNVTVSDPDRIAAMLHDLFGWKIRWQGAAASGGRTIHVGDDDCYVALYRPPDSAATQFGKGQPLNHIGVEVEDLDATKARVVAAGLEPMWHADYHPGRRFYFHDPDGIEYEVVSYRPA